MMLLEDNYLGASGSRGYGKIEFDNITLKKRDQSYYKENKEETIIISNAKLVDTVNKVKS